ncbi:MAG: 2Fe-2S iron-sulfur cluster-binding protein [Pseudomonadota bacterium]
MNAKTDSTATLTIMRGEYGELTGHRFDIPFRSGASILDGLMWIRQHYDASLAFRFSCINANVCRECVMQIDGEVAYACVERLKEGTTHIAPIDTKPHIRDLVCETTPPKERWSDGEGD